MTRITITIDVEDEVVEAEDAPMGFVQPKSQERVPADANKPLTTQSEQP